MAEPIVRVTLFVPGAAALQQTKLDGVESEWVENDGTFGKAFLFGTVPPDAVARIAAAPGALVLYWTVDLLAGRAQIVAGVEQLRAAGALAVRIEQSKLGWETDNWLELFGGEDPQMWHRGAVAFLQQGKELQSCGMHAFSLPDVRADDHALAQVLNVYQLAEDPMLRSGQTFAPDAATPRRVVERWPDVGYPSDHPCHNPYGVWRLGKPGGKARAIGEHAMTFMPPLVVILTALESRAGKPLTKKQVVAARDDGACIAMAPRDAQQLERSRGYADLDPELAWEQWQAIVATR